MVVVVKVAPRAEPVKQRPLETVLVAVGEVRHLRVKRRPRRATHRPFRPGREPVARRLAIARYLALDLNVVELRLAEHRDLAPALEIPPLEAVHVAAVPGHMQPQVRDVQVPRLRLPAHARPDAPLPQREGPAAARTHVYPMLQHEAVHLRPGRIGLGIELRHDGLELYTRRPKANRQMGPVVRLLRPEQTLPA